MIKIGDKVETPFGVGVIHNIDRFQYENNMYWISFNGMPEISFDENNLKPYRTAHEKLIDFGWKHERNIDGNYDLYTKKINEVRGKDYIVIIKNEIEVFNARGFRVPLDLELISILKQYLEELEND